MKIIEYNRCNCGAITVYFEDGQRNSLREENLSKFKLSLEGAEDLGTDWYACDHCVNHFGIDLCECGSGEEPENCCENGTRQIVGLNETESDLLKEGLRDNLLLMSLN